MIECNLKDLKLPEADKIAAAFRTTRKEVLDEAETYLTKNVQGHIRFSGMTIRTGSILRWQKKYRETGYAAVRPQAEDDGLNHPSPGPNSPGAITNYLESGHITRGSKGVHLRPNDPKRKDRSRIPGFRFYEISQTDIRAYARDVAKKYADRVAEKISKG